MSYKKIGDLVKFISNKNTDGNATILFGINIDKFFMPSVANIIGVDLKKYKVVKKYQFACNRMHVGRDERLPISMSTFDYDFIVSPAYDVFEVISSDVLPEYLMLWFRRKEFDRQCWFYTDADVRGGLHLDALKSIEIKVPSIEEQRQIVAQYQSIANKIKVNEQICEKLEATAQTLYKQWFVDFEFPCLPSGYRPHGQVNQNLPIDEYITKIGSVCTYSRVGGLPVSDGKTWFVYLILCENDSVYKGITNDLYRRFYEHYMGEGAEWTKLNKPLKVIHWESFATKEEAAKREKDLKTGYGRTWINRQIEKAGGITQLKTSLPAPQTELRTAGKMVYNQELEKEIPEGWEVNEISNFCSIGSSKRIYESEYVENGVPFYRGKEITLKKEGKNINEPYFISNDRYTELVKKYGKPTEGDILMTAVGTIGSTYMVEKEDFYFKDGNIIWFKDFKEIALNYYLYDFMQSSFFTDLINEITIGSTQSAITISTFGMQKLLKPSNLILERYKLISKNNILLTKKYKSQNQKLTQLQSLLLSRLATLEGE